jgi:hypothetical protein
MNHGCCTSFSMDPSHYCYRVIVVAEP